MAENNELGIQVGVVLDTSDIGKQLGQIKEDDRKIKIIADTDEVKKSIEKLTKDLQDGKNSDSVKLVVDVLQEESSKRIQSFLSDVQKQYEASPVRIALDVDTKATTANINKAVGEMQQQVQKAVDQAAKVNNNIKLDTTTNGAGVQLINTNQIKEARQELEGTEGIIKRIQSGIMQTIGNKQQFQPNTEIEKSNQGLGKTVTIYKELNEELTKMAGSPVLEEVSRTYETNFQKIEQEAQKLADYLSKQETEFNKLYSTAFEQKNPLTGEFADKALDALQKYQDEYKNVMKAGTIATDEQKRKIEELHQAAIQAIKEQQSLQQQFNSDKRQDYSGLFGQSKEWEAALKQITDAENKLNEIQKNAFSGTNALTGDFAKEATRQIDEVKNKFAEIRKTAEESFGGAATVSKDALKKMVDDLKSDLDRLAKLEYPSDKLAAQNVDVKKAFATDALAEMEERLKSLGNSTTEYYNKIQDLKTILSTVGQVDSDPSAWAKFRNEFHMLEDEIKKFEASTQGMGQKLAAGLENNQLQQVTEMIDRLNNIDEKFSGAGVERLQQSLQSLAQEYMNVIEQLQNPNLSKDEYDALASKVKELSDQFRQAQNAVKIFNDGFKNEGDLKKYEQSADALRLRFEQLQKTYANLANKNPEIANRFREVENAINGMDPTNVGEVTRQVGNLAKECGNASGQTAGLRGALTDAFGGLGSYLARFTSSYYIITKTIQGIKKMVTAVKEVDTSLVELQKVTNLTGDSLAQFTDKAYQMGAQLGRTGKDVIDAATTFSRAGYDLNEATQLAQSALVMTNVGVDIPNMESAASDMISILKAFDIQAEESMGVIDKLYNVANKEPLDFGNITQMLVTAGGTLAQAGTSLEETMGLLTGAFATMRNTSVANGLIFISQRLRGLDEDGEAIDGLIPKLQSLFSTVGIGIEDMNGELRSPFEILQDLAGVWDQLSSKQKQYFGEKVAGNRQVKTLNAIMQNWDVVADTIDKANNAQGEALKGNEMYMDSIEGRMTQLQSAFQELAKNTINSDFVKGLVSAGTEIVKVTANAGGLVPVLTTIIGLIVTIKGAKIAEGLGKIWTAFSTLFTGMSSGLSLTTGWVGVLITLAGAFVAIKTAVDNAHSSLKKFEEAKAAYDEQKTKVESLNGELKTTRDKIDEIQGKGTLTLIEQKELDDLKEASAELEKQIKYEEELLRLAKQEEKEAAVNNYKDESNRQHKGGFFGEDVRYSEAAEDALGLDWLIQNTKMQNNWDTGGETINIGQLMPTEIERVNANLATLTTHLNELKNVNEELKNTDPSDELYGGLLDRQTELNKYITDTEQELRSFYSTLVERTDGFDYVENAAEGSVDAQMNAMLDLRKQIESAFANAVDRDLSKGEIFENILKAYPEAIKEIQAQIKELGSDWQLGVPDSVKEDMKQTQQDLIEQAQKIVDVFEQFDDEDIHASLGDILKKLLDTGNIKDIERPIIDAAKMYEAGWKEFEEIIGSDSISTYYSSQYSEIVDNIPFTISVTPIGADGSVLSPEELDDYVYEQIDNATNLEKLMENDKLENGGKGLFIHLTPAIDIDPEEAAQIEGQFGELLHSIDGAFEQAFVKNADGEKVNIIGYLRDTLYAAIEDPSYTGQALTEIYTVANTLAENGYTELLDALSQVNVPEAIRQGFGLDNMTVEDLGIENLEGLVQELMTRLGFTVEEIEQAFQEKYGEGGSIKLNIFPDMSVDVEETMGKLYQVSDGYTKVLTKALSEQEKAGSLTAATIQKVLGESGLNGVAECLEKTANGYQLNTEKVNDYINAQNADIRLNAIAGIMERQIAIENLTVAMQGLSDEEYNLAENQILSWENEIAELQAVADEAYNAVDALDALREASKTSNEDADHTDAQGLLQKTKEMYEVGKVGTDDFRKGMDYLLGEGWYEQFNGDLDKAFKAFEEKRKRYFADDDADSALSFMGDLEKKGFANYDKATGKIQMLKNEATGADYTLEEIAKAFGISEDAARDMFELLNSYSFEDKFQFGDDVLDSAEKIAVAQERLNELDEKRIQKQKELEEAQKELNNANDEATQKEKAEEVKRLTGELDGLNTQYNELATSIDTANKAMEEDVETPQTLDEALEKIKEYQAAIATLEENGITCPVELTKDRDTLIELLSNPTTTMTVNASPGTVDAKIEKLVAFREAIENDPNISATVKATLIGLTDNTIKGLQIFKNSSREINGKTYRAKTTIKADNQATVVIKEVEDEIDEIPEEHDTTVKATMDEDSFEQVKTKITTWLDPESLTAEAKILAQTDDDSIKTATDKLDKVAEDRTVTYTITTKEPEPKDVQQIRSEAASDPNNLNKQAMAAVVQDVPLTPMPGPGFSLASDPTMWNLDYSVEAEVEAKPNEEGWQEGVEEVTEDPVEITVEPEKTPEEVADEFTAAWGESWTQPFEIPIGTSLDEEEATQEVEDAIEGMTPPEAPIDVDSETLVDKIKNLIKNTKLGDLIVNVKQKVEKAKTTTPKDVTQTVTVKGRDVGATKSVQNVQKEAEKGATVPVDADTTEAKTENKNLVDIIKEKVLKPVGLAFGDIAKQISDLEQRLAQEVQKKVKITYEETNQRPYAKGTKKAEEGISLVDEKGAELIEHTKRGTFELGTNDGARLTHLDEGDVVHTAEETKKILSRLADAGGFFKNGLNKAKSLIGNAFATGVSGGGVVKPKKKKEDKTKKKSSTGSSRGSSTGSSSGSSSDATKDETSKWSEWARQFFDWVEIKLKKLKNATKEFTDEAARAVGAWAKNDNIKEAINSIDEEIDANKRAYDEYLNTANEVLAHSTKLTNDILRQIANGTIDVTRYDEVTQQQIKDYQTWYEKAIACRDAIKQLTDQQRELAKQRLQNIVDDYSAYTRIYDTEGSVGAAQREYYESLGKATQGTSIAREYLDSNGNVILGKNDYAKNAYEENAQATEDALNENIEIIDGFVDDYGDAIDEFVDLTLDLSTELESGKLLDGSLSPDIVHRKTGNEYGSYSDEIYSSEAKKRELEEARSYLQSEFDALVSQGLVRVGDDTWLEYTNKLKELDKDIYQTGTNIEKLKDQANDAALIPFRNQISDFTYEASKATQEMDLGNERGSLSRRGKRNTYEDLIDNAQSQNKNLAIQNKLYEQLQTGLDKNSQKYQDLEKKIRDNETAMLSNEQAIEKYKNAITQLRFDELADDLEDLTNASDAYNDEITIKTLKGIELTESAYKNLINNGKDQINNLNRQKASYQVLMQELVRLYGEEAKSSDLYRQYESQVDSLDASIRDMSISMLEWQDEMENIKVEKIGWQIDRLKNQADALSDALSMKNAKGVAVVSRDYQQLIDNANEQRRNLLNQNAEYLSQQRGMDVNSKAYQDLQSKIESNLKTMRSLDASTVQWSEDIKNIPVQKLGWDLDKLKDISDQLSDSLNLKELKGIEVVDRDYSNLINNANERRNLLLKQSAEYISQQKGMDKYSEAYQELEGKIRSTQEELRQLDESTIKWKKDMASLKVQKLSWQLDELNAAIDRINNRKSLNETQGYDIASDVFQSLIENSMRRIELLKQENQLLQNQQVGMDKNSTAYQELQKQIVDNINEIDSIKISQEEWNDNIVDTGIKNIQKYRDSLSKSNDQLQRQKELQQAIQELEKADSQRKVRTYVEGQGFVYQRDEDEFRKAQENLEDVIKDQLLGKIDDLIDALEESKNNTNVYDKNGNLLGSVYNTPQLGNLADLLTRYYANNNNATLDIDLLKNAFGKNIVSNINPQSTQTSFSIGDIVINEVKDGNELARTIVDQFPNALLQALYSKS